MFLNILKYAMPIVLIVLCTFDIFRIVISKKEEDIKKYRKYIYNRIFNCILLFLVPTIIFLLFNLLLNETNISSIGDVQKCWNMVE